MGAVASKTNKCTIFIFYIYYTIGSQCTLLLFVQHFYFYFFLCFADRASKCIYLGN